MDNELFDLSYSGEARELIMQYRIKSIGRRPIDYMVRDLLFFAPLRDRRNGRLIRAFHDPPAWLGVSRETDSASAMALSFRLLHFFHARNLLRLKEDLTRDYTHDIDRLLNCWPMMAEVTWVGAGDKSPRDVCEQSRLCPFCYARQVRHIFQSLVNYQANRRHPSMLVQLSLMRDFPVDMRECDDLLVSEINITRQIFSDFRHAAGNALVSRAKYFGASGGLTTIQAAPQLLEDFTANDHSSLFSQRRKGLRVRVTVLAEIESPTRELIELTNDRSHGVHQNFYEIDCNQDTIRVDVVLQQWSNDADLRRMLVGCRSNDSFDPSNFENLAAFSWGPWHLCDATQWIAYRDITRGTQLYSPWGAWRTVFTRSSASTNYFANATAEIRGSSRRSQAFATHNQRKQDDFLHRCDDALAVVRAELIHQFGAVLPTGRTKIAQILASARRSESNRVIRRVAQLLKNEAQENTILTH